MTANSSKPELIILYCRQCNWLMRASWMAQELLASFSEELGQVTLKPGTGGIFEIRVAGNLIWERKRDNGFPDISELKRRVRDCICPERNLGHHDRTT